MPTPGGPKRTIRIEPEIWDAFVAACPQAERGHESGAAAVIREFILWYSRRDPTAKRPQRPPA